MKMPVRERDMLSGMPNLYDMKHIKRLDMSTPSISHVHTKCRRSM